MMSDPLDQEALDKANSMAAELTKLLIHPVLEWYHGENKSLGAQLVATANMTAIMTCMCVLEELYGTENLRVHIEKTKAEAKAYATATRH